jgi:SAM-dependent methyltransferase
MTLVGNLHSLLRERALIEEGRVPVLHTAALSSPVRVFISYAHGDPDHEGQVYRLYRFLSSQGIEAPLDKLAAEQRQDWSMWTLRQIRAARFVLVIASPEYRRRAEGEALPSEGRGVQWEAKLIRDEIYADQQAALNRFLPVILPGGSVADVPQWMSPATTTHYKISDYTVVGAERLLRFLTGQPYETQPPLGAVPVLPTRRDGGSADCPSILQVLIQRLVDRTPRRNEAMVQADVRQFLAAGDLGLEERDLGAELDAQTENQRRIDIAVSCTVIEVRKDLREIGVLKAAEQQLAGYVAACGERTGQRYVAILTDGAEWRLYRSSEGSLQQVTLLTVSSSAPNVNELLMWLESVLASGRQIEPTQQEIARKLGAQSPSYLIDAAELEEIYVKHRDLATVKVKRGLWAKLLTTALGTNFTDEDSLFVDHTLLVAMAKVIGHSVAVSLPSGDPQPNAATIISGALFSDAQIGGVVEPDFFDWIAEVPDGDRFIESLARRLNRFAWDQVEHDIMKVLYESIISPQTRKKLGEYYTPGWLAEEIIAECVRDPLAERVLDASCGSGTFLHCAVRSYLLAAEAAGMSNAETIQGVVTRVIGVDVHPVAVTLARVTYLLAIGKPRLQSNDRPPFSVPVYLGDSLRWGLESDLFSPEGLSVPTDDDQRQTFINQPDYADKLNFADRLKFPDRVVADADCFDRLVIELANKATKRRPGGAAPSLTATFHRYAIHDADRTVLQRTFKTMCELHDQGRDHIWGYTKRNVSMWTAEWLTR